MESIEELISLLDDLIRHIDKIMNFTDLPFDIFPIFYKDLTRYFQKKMKIKRKSLLNVKIKAKNFIFWNSPRTTVKIVTNGKVFGYYFTDNKGEVELNRPEGNYDILGIKKGREKFRKININEDKTIRLNFFIF